MKSLFVSLLLLVTVFFAPGCSSGTNVGQVVCDYGNVLCDVSTTLCTEIPGVPTEVCNYLDLACYNLQTICDLRDSTETIQFEKAVSNIKLATEKLKQWKLAKTD